MTLLLGTSLVPTKRCHPEQGRSSRRWPAARVSARPARASWPGLGRRRSVSRCSTCAPGSAVLQPLASSRCALHHGILARRGAVAVGMARQGYDLQLTRYDEKGWRATFYRPGWSTRPWARPAPAGSARRGMRS